MADPDYDLIRVTGSSTKSIDDATGRAIESAVQRGTSPEWFELGPIRGTIRDGRIANFEVVVTLGQPAGDRRALRKPGRTTRARKAASRPSPSQDR